MRHMKTVHEQSKPFECDLCQSKFSLQGNLNLHLRTDHAQIGSSKFAIESDLVGHMKVKSSAKIQAKPDDDNLRKDKKKIGIHKRKKGSEIKFQNERALGIENEGKSNKIFEKKEKSRITPKCQSKLYHCDICEEDLSNGSRLEEHFTEIHNSGLAYACNACYERYPKEDMLIKHQQCCKKLN